MNHGKKSMINKNIFLFIIFIISFFFTANKDDDKIDGKIVCFGDSITYGALVNQESWVFYLSKEHLNINFMNAGKKGRKTSDRDEILPVLKKHPNADYFLIFLGVNDLKNGNDSLVNNCVENMNWMINKIKKTNLPTGQAGEQTKIIILASTDINLKTMSEINISKKYNENTKSSLYKLEKKYRKLAQKDSVGFISLLHTVSSQNYVDGLHPNEKGQKEIVNAVWAGINR